MGLRLVTPASVLATSLEEIKKDLRVDHIDDDAALTRHIEEATQWVEYRVQRKAMPQTWEFIIDAFPVAEVRLPFIPVIDVNSVKYDDPDALEIVMPGADYYLDKTSEDAWIFPTTAWPITLDAVNSVRIEFVAGHVTAAAIPGPIKAAIRLKVQDLYDQRDTDQSIHRLLTNYYRMVA